MKETKKKFKGEIVNYLAKQGTDVVLSEAAFPAYAHKNPLIDYIFWKRLGVVEEYINSNKMPYKILDFGCGTGVLSYELANKGHNLVSVDLNLKPVKILRERIKYPVNIKFFEGNLFSLKLEQNSFDKIIALDVLEHMDEGTLKEYLKKFETLLKEDGEIIVSGPTENVLYKVGRKLAGSDFTGDYHHSNIKKIIKSFKQLYKVTRLGKLLPFLPLFEIYAARKY